MIVLDDYSNIIKNIIVNKSGNTSKPVLAVNVTIRVMKKLGVTTTRFYYNCMGFSTFTTAT